MNHDIKKYLERTDCMFQHLFVPLDGSPGAERAIPLAARLARSVGGSITCFSL